MFHKWGNWVVGDCTSTIMVRSIRPVSGGRVDPTTHVIRRRISAHYGRWLRVVSGVLVVLGRRVRVGVWGGSSKHISVCGYFRLRRRLTLVATVVPPPVRTAASIISHSVFYNNSQTFDPDGKIFKLKTIFIINQKYWILLFGRIYIEEKTKTQKRKDAKFGV